MRHVFWLLAMVSLACAPAAPGDGTTGITGACVRSFRPALDAWETALGRVPAECAYLDQEYSVELFSAAELPCDDPGPGEQVLGCTEQPTMAIYILKRRGRRVLVHHGHKSRTNVELVDTSVHEWIHALADCVDGDMDLEHVRAELWAPFGAESVEIQGQAFAEIGECL